MDTLFINGKFCAQRTTGVQRFAAEVVRAIDEQWHQGPAPVLLTPRDAVVPALRHVRVEPVGPAGLPLHLWEQVVLPWRARSGRLLNLSGSAPAWARGRIATLHDAAVFDHPEAYTRRFRVWYRWLFRRCARRDDTVLTVSAFSQQRLAQALGVAPGRFDVIPGAGDHLAREQPDERVLARLGVAPGRFALCVASANPTKGLDLLLDAWGRSGLAAAGARLVLVGGQHGAVFRSAPHEELPQGVNHAGACSDAELAALLRAALLLVVPSRYEGFGLPMLEAMGVGCPVVAARAGALPEVGGEAAMWVPADDAPALAEALAGVWGDPVQQQWLREAGRARAAQFGWAASAQRLLQRLDRPCPPPAHPPGRGD